MEFHIETNRIYAEDPSGRLLAEVTFPPLDEGTVIIDHTFVDASLRGQGIAGKLMEAAARQLRETGRKAVPSCSYAVDWFERQEAYRDIISCE